MADLTALLVLGEPRRQEILEALRDGECTVGHITDRLGLSQPGVSKHLKVLRDAGLVQARAEGQRRLYRIRPEPLVALEEWLDGYRQLWEGSLDRLEEHLDKRRQK